MSRIALICAAGLALAVGAAAQDELEERVRALEEENRVLQEQIGILADEFERNSLGAAQPEAELGQGEYGLAPGASKIYGRLEGLSIGGYGEFLFESRAGRTDRFDALRAVTYIGYKFNDQWLFNSEFEFEHATTDDSSGTTSSEGSASIEFAYIDYLHSESLGFRGGLVLVPMGLTNEQHEPTSFLAARRPQTEQRILPTTWRENGLGAFGDVGGFEWRAFAINGFEGADFSASGLRGGRQKGNRAAAEDIAVVGRLDWVDTPGLALGGSLYFGDSGQGAVDVPDLATTIAEVHAEVERGPWSLRALAAFADIDDTAEFNTLQGANLAEELEGHYVELGYDLLTKHSQSLTPFVRYEHIDTQASLASGFAPDQSQDEEVLTFGLNYKPTDQVVLKLDFEDWDDSGDQWNFLIGYVF